MISRLCCWYAALVPFWNAPTSSSFASPFRMLSPIIPALTSHFPVSPIIPAHTKNRGWGGVCYRYGNVSKICRRADISTSRAMKGDGQPGRWPLHKQRAHPDYEVFLRGQGVSMETLLR